MTVASGFPFWVSGHTRRGQDLLRINGLVDAIRQWTRDGSGAAAPALNWGISAVYFESLFGVRPREYLDVLLKDVEGQTGLLVDAMPDEEDAAHSSEDEALAAAGKQRVPWRQWSQCVRGPKCCSTASSGTEPCKVVMDGAGRPICRQCQEAKTDVEKSGISETDKDTTDIMDGMWFVKYRRTIMPLLVCQGCSYGRPYSLEEQWHDGIQDVAKSWTSVSKQPTFVCGRCRGTYSGRRMACGDEGIPVEHFGPGSERDHTSALSGTPLWLLQSNDDSTQHLSPDDGMPFPGWEPTSNEDVTFHDRICVYFNKQSGKYYVFDQTGEQWIEQFEQPRLPVEHPITCIVEMWTGSRSLSTTAKDETPSMCRCVIAKDLRKAGDLLKTPVPHLDRGALLILASGLRGHAAVEFVAKNLPGKVIAKLSKQRGHWSEERFHDMLCSTLMELDEDWMKCAESPHDGCSLALALHVGNQLHVAGLGVVQTLISQIDGLQPRTLTGQHTTASASERQRLSAAGGLVDEAGNVRRASEKVPRPQTSVRGTADEIDRVLNAPHSFARLGLMWPLSLEAASADLDAHAVRSAYRKQAVRVHPDKVSFELGHAAKQSFEQLSSSCEALEDLSETHGSKALTELCRLVTAPSDEEALDVEAGADCQAVAATVSSLRNRVAMLGDILEVKIGLDRLQSIEYSFLKTAPPAGLKPVSVTRAIGIKDLKDPLQLITAKPTVITLEVPDGCSTVALLHPPLLEAEVFPELRIFDGRPRAAMMALRQIQKRMESNEDCSCIVFCLKNGGEEHMIDELVGPPNKKQKILDGASQSPASVRVRHILLRHQGAKSFPKGVGDSARGKPSTHTTLKRSKEDAELHALSLLRMLLAPGGASLFPSFASKHSECLTAKKAGGLAGDCGWVARRNSKGTSIGSGIARRQPFIGSVTSPGLHLSANMPQSASSLGILGIGNSGGLTEHPEEFISASLALGISEISDLVSTESGVHIIQRLA